MKTSAVSSAVPNIKTMPTISQTSTNTSSTILENRQPLPPKNSIKNPSSTSSSTGISSIGLTGLESTEGNFAESYIPPNDAILAEFAFAKEVYKKNKRKYQKMLASPAIQHFMLDENAEGEESAILLKP